MTNEITNEWDNYRLDGTERLSPDSLPCESIKGFQLPQKIKQEKYEKKEQVMVEGDGSSDIEGSITFRSKEGAIMFIQGLMEQYDISSDELDY